MESTLKLCISCGEEKPLEDFPPSKGRKDGRYPYCRKCGRNARANPAILEKRRKEAAEKRALYVPPPTKTCFRCKIEKPRDAFYNSSKNKDGKYSYCADCERAEEKEKRRLRQIERARVAALFDPNTKVCPCCGVRKQLTEFYTSSYSKTGRNSHCKECINTRSKQRYHSDPAYRKKVIQNRKNYYAGNRERVAEAKRQWIASNPERHRANLKRRRAKLVVRPEFHLETNVRAMIKAAIRDNQGRKGWRVVLGYTFDALKRHIESKFTDGMTWALLCARKIEIDHVIPRAAFYYETLQDPDFRACWALDNLQPLWRSDNRAKGDKMPDGSSGRKIGKKKRELYELRLAQMAAGGSAELLPEMAAISV